MAGTRPLGSRIHFQWRNPDQHHTRLNHAEIFSHAARNINHAAPMLGVHTVIDLDDGTAIIVQPPDGDNTTQCKAITGGGKLFDVETFASRSLSPLKTMTIKTGLTTQTNGLFVGDLCLKDFGRRQILILRCFSRLFRGFTRVFFARRPDGRRAIQQQQAAHQSGDPVLPFRRQASALRHPDGPEFCRCDKPPRPAPSVQPWRRRHQPRQRQ
jgi:hypothetical protein